MPCLGCGGACAPGGLCPRGGVSAEEGAEAAGGAGRLGEDLDSGEQSGRQAARSHPAHRAHPHALRGYRRGDLRELPGLQRARGPGADEHAAAHHGAKEQGLLTS